MASFDAITSVREDGFVESDSGGMDQTEDEEMKEDGGGGGVVSQDDPNIVAPGEKPEEYGRLDSDEENGGMSVYDDDKELEITEPDPAIEDDDVAPPELPFDPSLVEAIGGVGNIATGNVNASFLADMKMNGWTLPQNQTPYPYMDEPYEARPDDWMGKDHPGLFDGEDGPTPEALAAGSTPMGVFFLFVKPRLLESIAGASNNYFMENMETRMEDLLAKQRARKQKRPEFEVQSPEQIRQKLLRTPDISGRDVSGFIELPSLGQ